MRYALLKSEAGQSFTEINIIVESREFNILRCSQLGSQIVATLPNNVEFMLNFDAIICRIISSDHQLISIRCQVQNFDDVYDENYDDNIRVRF